MNRQAELGLGPQAVVASVVTPFHDDERIDYTAWQSILETLISEGVDAVLAAGQEGEWYALSEEERVVVLRFCRQTIGKRVPLIGNIAAGSTVESVRLARAAESERLDGLFVLRPWAPALAAAEWAGYLEDIRAAVRIPVFAPEELATSAGANLVPRAYVERSRALSTGRLEDAARLAALIGPLEALFTESSAAAVVKEAMRRAGMRAGICRRPLGDVPEELAARIAGIVERLRSANCLPQHPVQARAF
jgi:dihydrodipicolinate synthase/N-acetylneuraminate lyase